MNQYAFSEVSPDKNECIYLICLEVYPGGLYSKEDVCHEIEMFHFGSRTLK